jgi:hypothetical protein
VPPTDWNRIHVRVPDERASARGTLRVNRYRFRPTVISPATAQSLVSRVWLPGPILLPKGIKMNQHELDHAVARATGETVNVIRQRGFSEIPAPLPLNAVPRARRFFRHARAWARCGRVHLPQPSRAPA